MVDKKTTAIAKVASDSSVAELMSEFPMEVGFTRVLLPRLAFKSQDVMEGVGKAKHVVVEAGTFFREVETDETDDENRKIWDKQELGAEIEGQIVFQRKQLRYYDEATETFTSSPVYDTDDEILPLFCEKKEVGRGTPAELKALYAYEEDGKRKSRLEENRILYVLYTPEDGDAALHQLNLRGSSMYSFLAYMRKTPVPAVITVFNSEPKEKGSIAWNQMTFTAKRKLTESEVQEVLGHIHAIKEGIALEKQQFVNVEKSELEKEFDKKD